MADGVDFSAVYRMQNGFLSEAERIEVDLKALAQRRASAVHSAAQNRLPRPGEKYATGKTRAALHIVDDSAKKQFRVEVGDIPGRDPMVAVYIEFGTVGTAARPYLRPSVDENRDGYTHEATELIKRLEKA